MTKYPDIFTALAAPFAAGEVRTKPGGGGRQLSYVTARTIMNRLDTVLGPENWSDDYTPLDKTVVCRLTVRLPDGQLLTKVDAGNYATDAGDEDKSGFSDAFKRAAVKFGPGRYLYNDGVATLATPASAAIAATEPATLPLTKPVVKPSTTLPEIKTARELYRFASTNHLVPVLGEMGRKAGLPSRIVDWADLNARIIWEQYVEALPSFSKNGTGG